MTKRTPEQLRNHYEVEKELADRLRRSSRKERSSVFATLYDELFRRVPDHPRLVRRDTPEMLKKGVSARLQLLEPFLDRAESFVEFAGGDCTLAFEVCRHVSRAMVVDISDQTAGSAGRPDNFQLILYDGYHLDLPDDCADLAFSYQFLEHLHPDDVMDHLKCVRRLLRPGGRYVFSTPHRFSGPHDISRYFSDVPEGFHLKEWTYREMGAALKEAGFAHWSPYIRGRLRNGSWFPAMLCGVERMVGPFPHKLRRAVCQRGLHDVMMAAE